MGKAIRWTPEQLAAHNTRKVKQEPTSAQAGLQALGRLQSGAMNKTEARYADYLEARCRVGEVAWFKFEGIKLKLADNTSLTPDFFVMLATRELEVHEVKGARRIYTDDAKAKTKIAAGMFPFTFRVVFPKDGGGWDIEKVGNKVPDEL
jgi:hypothetical protein